MKKNENSGREININELLVTERKTGICKDKRKKKRKTNFKVTRYTQYKKHIIKINS
jgi:hypothetical protein